MPNGGNWDRFCFVLQGFRAAHGSWPTQVRSPQRILAEFELRLGPADWRKVCSRIEFVADDMVGFVAADAEGRDYTYCGPAAAIDIRAEEWLGVSMPH